MTDRPPVPPPPALADILARWRDRLPRTLPRTLPTPAVAVFGLIVVAAVAGTVLLTRGSDPPPAVVLPRADGGGGPGGTGAGAATPAGGPGAGAGTSEPGGTTVTVHAAGALAHPGVYVLPAEARVADVMEAAGGALPEADVDQLNLALRVADGERVYLPRKGEAAVPPPAAPSSGGGGGGPRGGTATTRGQLLDLNTATAGQLEALPGIGPSLAQAIVEHRTRHGRFRSVDDLLEVPGIGPAKLGAVRPLVRV